MQVQDKLQEIKPTLVHNKTLEERREEEKKCYLMLIEEDSSSTFLPTFSNLNPINDTRHPVKTGQNRPPLQKSASLSQAVDSPEC